MEEKRMDGTTTDEDCSDALVSPFDYSIENYFRAMDTIFELCGVKEEEEKEEASCASELEWFSSTITFLREWKYLCYKPRTIRFADEIGSAQGEDVCNGVNLPQFSSASVPKLKRLSSETSYFNARKDFLLYAGGPVWALDWCPSVQQRSDCRMKCEYLAVAAHPADSSYHKIGAALIGRGVIQIWCLLNVSVKEEELPPSTKPKGRGKGSGKGSGRGRGRPRKKNPADETSPPLKKPRGRPRKKTIIEETCDLDSNSEYIQPLSVHSEKERDKPSPPLKKSRGRPKMKTVTEESFGDLDSNSQLVQVLDVQFDRETDKALPPLQKARGRSRKKTVTEEPCGDLASNSQLAIQLYTQTDKNSPPLKNARERLKKKTATEESCGVLDNNNQYVQALAVQVDKKTNKTSPLLDKPKRRPRKNTVTEECYGDIESNSQFVQALGVLVDKETYKTSIPSEKAKGRSRKKNISEKSCGDLDSNSQFVQALAVQLDKETNITSLQLQKVKRKVRKKKIVIESSNDVIGNNQIVPNLSVEPPEDPSGVLTISAAARHSHEQATVKIPDEDVELHIETQEGCGSAVLASKPCLTYTRRRKRKLKERAGICNDDFDSFDPLLSIENRANESSFAVLPASTDCGQHPVASSQKEVTDGCSETNTPNLHLPNDVILPRVVLCLAHNGKVAWDVKWRPSNSNDYEDKHCMGYLAVLLGNGSLEVWKVPFPRTVKILYSSHKKEGTDPRFMKLTPVFRCSKLKFGDRQSIPLTLEWSRSPPHDLILAGCHDGTVALWRFSPSGSSQDTRPLLCFSADNVPIRALAWAPSESDAESANVIATAGHGGLRFWDLRDPCRPLWDLNPVRRVIYSLDWLSDPRCIIMSSDDGTLRFISLSKSAIDVPVTGTPFTGTQQQGLHSYLCSSFPIWSVHASRSAGMVAYCTSDGSVLRFQLTSKAVDKDPSRNRAPHFLCGSLTDEDPTLAVNTPLPDVPFPMKKSLNEWADTPRSIRGFLSKMYQAKRANVQTPDDSELALCYGDDPSNLGSGKTLASRKSKTTPKKKTPASNQALLSIGEEPENIERGGEKQKGEKETEIEVFPSKIVAMHRVRWNMNKGSERWLCYGGAAGIVRCQEISMRSIA